MKKKNITIGYISNVNPFEDRKHWSGLTYKIREAIENAGFKVKYIPYRTDTFSQRWMNRLLAFVGKITQKHIIGGDQFPLIAKLAAKTIDFKDIDGCDYLFFPNNGHIALHLNTTVPKIEYSGATVPIMLNYYWFNVLQASRRISIAQDRKTTLDAFINIKASDWAANSVINDYGFPKNRTFVLEYGPAIDTHDITPIESYKSGPFNILFSGVEWERKNGDIAIQTVQLLREKNIDAHIYIAGIRNLPEYCKSLSYVHYVGFLNKNTKDGYQKYLNLFHTCHIMLVPTKAECAGVVFCEASAFGMPSYTYRTGGIPNYVVDGINGRTIELSTGAERFAQIIYDDITNHRMEELRNGALRISKEKLSWEAWSRHFRTIIDKI